MHRLRYRRSRPGNEAGMNGERIARNLIHNSPPSSISRDIFRHASRAAQWKNNYKGKGPASSTRISPKIFRIEAGFSDNISWFLDFEIDDKRDTRVQRNIFKRKYKHSLSIYFNSRNRNKNILYVINKIYQNFFLYTLSLKNFYYAINNAN